MEQKTQLTERPQAVVERDHDDAGVRSEHRRVVGVRTPPLEAVAVDVHERGERGVPGLVQHCNGNQMWVILGKMLYENYEIIMDNVHRE